MSIAYVWINGAVLEMQGQVIQEDAKHYGIQECFILDSHFDAHEDRYGMFKSTERFDKQVYIWTHIPITDFPKEFRAHLLLLNIQ
jgi:hypothetical protein